MIGKAIAAALVPLVGLLGIVALVAAVIGALNPFNNTDNTDTPGTPGGSSGEPSAKALADIPANYLALYQDAARVCPGLHWSILAGIGKVESNHGRSNLPGVHSGQNQAGAKGPMQFLQSTFDAIEARHPLPGNGGLIAPSPYDPSDAIHAAAYLLCDNGARNNRDIYTAIWNYNHDPNYVTRVLEIAHQYAATPHTPDQPGQPEPDGAPPQAQPAPAPRDPRVAPSATGALVVPPRLAARPLAATLGHRGPATSSPTTPARHGRRRPCHPFGRRLAERERHAARPMHTPVQHRKRPAHARTDRPDPTRRPRPRPPFRRLAGVGLVHPPATRGGAPTRRAAPTTARPARAGRGEFRRTGPDRPGSDLWWPVVSEAPGLGLRLGQQTLGPNPTPQARLLAADLDHLGMQVTPETVLQIRNVVLGVAQRLHDARYREERNVKVGPPGGDPISGRWANVTNDKIPALLAEYQIHIDVLNRAGENLRQTAQRYGYTEQVIADSFKKFMNANQGAWSQRLQQDETQAGLPPRIRDLLDHPPLQPGPRAGAELFRTGLQ